MTPTCPYCPTAVIMAHKLALLNRNIVADMVEAQEFPELVMRYRVQGVPRTVVGNDVAFEGALPEPIFVQKVLEGYHKVYAET